MEAFLDFENKFQLLYLSHCNKIARKNKVVLLKKVSVIQTIVFRDKPSALGR